MVGLLHAMAFMVLLLVGASGRSKAFMVLLLLWCFCFYGASAFMVLLGGAKQFILTTAVSSFAKAQKMDNHRVGHYTTGVSTCPALRGLRHFFSTSYLFIAWCVHSVHIFLLHKSNTGETQTPKHFTDNYCIWSPYRSVE